jgi:nicotinamide-nucleotide amidase
VSDDSAIQLASDVIERLRSRGEIVAAAESCTGGGILTALTSIGGSSEAVWGGIVSYAIEAKTALLDVDPSLIEVAGVVSESVAKAMAWGMRTQSGADRTLAVTGIAGPGGGTPEVPVGTVWIAWYGSDDGLSARRFLFEGDRNEVRKNSVIEALKGLRRQLDRKSKASLY